MAQLKSTNITGNLAVTGNILASKIIKLSGTNDDILMGDGSTISKQGLIDSLETALGGDTTYSFTNGNNGFTVTPSGGTAQTVGVTSTKIFRQDTRNDNPTPYASGYANSGYLSLHLKSNSTLGITGQGTYSALVEVYPWADSSGGAAHQLAFGSSGAILHRYGTATWSAWNQLATQAWVEDKGYLTAHQSLSGYVTGTGLTSNTIMLGNGDSKIKTSSKTIATSLGTDDTTVPTSKAVKDYITGLGYITGSYLPLTGGEMSGPITYPVASGNNKTSNYISAGGGYATGSGKQGLKILAIDQSDATMGLGVDLTGGPYELTVATSRVSNSQASKIVFATHTVNTTAYKTLATLSASGAENPVATLNVKGSVTANGQVNIDTTSDTTMTTPAINILHTGPANGSSTADLMILSGYKSAPYGFKFSTYGDGTAIIQSQRISGGSEKFSLSLNPNGGDVLINGSKAATQAWVEGLGYVTGSYLPLAGGTMTGAIKYAGATREIISFAPTDTTWRGGLKYSWSSNTTIGLWGKHVNSQFVWHAGADFASVDVNGTTTRTYDFQVGRDVRSGGSGNLEALLGGKLLATQEWVEGKGYLTSHQSLSGYVTGSDLTANYFILGNGGSSIKKGNYRITTNIDESATNAYIPTAEAVETFVSAKLSGVGGSDKKTSSSSKANTELKLVGAVTASTDGVETFTNPNCYIGTDNCLYSNGKKVATEEWVEAAIKDTISSVSIYSEVLYDANGSVSAAVWTPGWRVDSGSWDPAAKNNNTAASYTMATVSSSNQTVTLRRPYNSISTHSRWVMEITASGMHGLSISGATVITVSSNKYKIQFKEETNQTITLSKGEATFVIKIVFQTASYQD